MGGSLIAKGLEKMREKKIGSWAFKHTHTQKKKKSISKKDTQKMPEKKSLGGNSISSYRIKFGFPVSEILVIRIN